MTMLERVGSYSNEYFNSLIREYTDKGKAPENHGMNRAIHAYLNTNDLKANELLVDDMPFMQDIDDFMGTIEAAGIHEFVRYIHGLNGVSPLSHGSWLGNRRQLSSRSFSLFHPAGTAHEKDITENGIFSLAGLDFHRRSE